MGVERGAVARPLVQTGTVRGPHGDFLVEGRIMLGSMCLFLSPSEFASFGRHVGNQEGR